jgi:hypothetical protein
VGAGTTLNVLDACLVTGFGQVTLSSLTIDDQGIATATSTSHGYVKVHTVILISGADQEAINGEWSITAIPNTDQVQFDATDSGLTSTTITGATITMKVAPLGWSKPFSDAPNFVSVYQSLDPMSRRNFLRVDDSDNLQVSELGATYFRGYEYMTSSEDNGIYPFPPKSSVTKGLLLRKSLYSNAGNYLTSGGSNISWTIVGTSKQFYFATHVVYGNDKRYRNTMFFGDFISYVPGDVGATGLSGDYSYGATYSGLDGVTRMNDYSANFCPRNSRRTHTVLQQRYRLWNYPTVAASGSVLIGYNHTILEPDTYPNRLIIYRPFLISDENNSTSIRGEMPGLAIALNNIVSTLLYEPGEIIKFGTERFIYMPTADWGGYHGFFLLSLDKDWSVPIIQ